MIGRAKPGEPTSAENRVKSERVRTEKVEKAMTVTPGDGLRAMRVQDNNSRDRRVFRIPQNRDGLRTAQITETRGTSGQGGLTTLGIKIGKTGETQEQLTKNGIQKSLEQHSGNKSRGVWIAQNGHRVQIRTIKGREIQDS